MIVVGSGGGGRGPVVVGVVVSYVFSEPCWASALMSMSQAGGSCTKGGNECMARVALTCVRRTGSDQVNHFLWPLLSTWPALALLLHKAHHGICMHCPTEYCASSVFVMKKCPGETSHGGQKSGCISAPPLGPIQASKGALRGIG